MKRPLATAALAVLAFSPPLAAQGVRVPPPTLSRSPVRIASAPVANPSDAATNPDAPLAVEPLADIPSLRADVGGQTGSPQAAGSSSGSNGLSKIQRGVSRTLDASAGQYWAEYDLRPYTQHLSNVDRPEQAVVDWIIRETGTDLWFRQPMGVLTADRQTLAVYHNDGVHEMVKRVYERFVNGNVEPQRYTVRMILVGSPQWRTPTLAWIRAVDLESPGLSGWLLNREQSAMLLATLRARSDVSELGMPELRVYNGQQSTVEQLRVVSYVSNYERREQPYPAYLPISDSIREGYQIKFSPLLPVDERTVEMAIECAVDQVERLNSVPIDLPTAGGTTQPLQITIPQMMACRFSERIAWPADQTLLLSCGVVAPPADSTRTAILNARTSTGLLGLGKFVPSPAAARADALLMIEYNGHAEPGSAASEPLPPHTATNPISHGRY